ncbi:B- and T-lymphocyte attenuator isoform X2 [Vicugna pacos]|uniref:B- and T-lymphocyte attenuator isoform X2 n=1 Tax=Vicugna pacos TaxID=30538 RepID=A0ABM5DK92_VICPA
MNRQFIEEMEKANKCVKKLKLTREVLIKIMMLLYTCSFGKRGWITGIYRRMLIAVLFVVTGVGSSLGVYRWSGCLSLVWMSEWTQNNSEHLTILTTISDTRNASGPPSQEEMADRQRVLYSLLPLRSLPLLITCFFPFCCLRSTEGNKKSLLTQQEGKLTCILDYNNSLCLESSLTPSSTHILKAGVVDFIDIILTLRGQKYS